MIRKKSLFKLFLLISISLAYPVNGFGGEQADQNLENPELSFIVQSPTREHVKIKCQFLIVGRGKFLAKLAQIVKYDLEFTDQLEVDLKRSKCKLNLQVESKLFDRGISLILYLEKVEKGKVKVELKEANSDSLIFEKEFSHDKKNVVLQGHKISNELLPILTGEEPICLTSLAYCKRVSARHQVVCVSDYACKKERTVVPTRTVNIAPCWHTKAPILFYSQFTKVNNRLMSVDLKTRKHKIICSYDGLNMQPFFSQDGTKAILCLSGGKNSEIYLYDYALCKKRKKRIFIQLTHNKGNNVSPCLLPNNDVIFCSDFQTGLPQIYYMDCGGKNIYRLTNGRGYCAAPSYSSKNNSIVYTRIVNGIFQLFTLNLDDLQEKQLTFGPQDKHEPALSECGRFVAFSYDQEYEKDHKTFQIAILNCLSGKIRVLTSGKEPKSFPRWGKVSF